MSIFAIKVQFFYAFSFALSSFSILIKSSVCWQKEYTFILYLCRADIMIQFTILFTTLAILPSEACVGPVLGKVSLFYLSDEDLKQIRLHWSWSNLPLGRSDPGRIRI